MLQTREEIKAYLDQCIRFWRQKKTNAKANITDEDNVIFDTNLCSHYIDAFQSTRKSIFDELLPLEKIKNDS